MKTVLMILTHDRLDCLKLCLEMLERGQHLTAFDHVVLLLNGVPDKLRRYVEHFMADHPEVHWDTVIGPGTRPEGISCVQNECIRRYPGCLYTKVDEDVFVPEGWSQRIFETYEQYKDRDDLALITPLIPNNAYGLHRLLTVFYPKYMEEFRAVFKTAPSQEPKGPTWQSPYIAAWATNRFISLNAVNRVQRELLDAGSASGRYERYHLFSDYFSIGCITYDYRHVERMGGKTPERDEPQWCDWIEKNNQVNVLDQSVIVLHYAFFVQQLYLDRMSVLEDIRFANLGGRRNFRNSTWPRLARIARQMPAVAKRRIFGEK